MKFVIILALLCLGAIISPSAQASPADNWILIQVIGGPDGATNATYSVETRAEDDGASPVVIGRAYRLPWFSEETYVEMFAFGGSPSVDVSKDGMRHHVDAGRGVGGSSFADTFGWHREVAPGQILSTELIFYAGTTFSRPPVLKRAAETGSLIMTAVTGSGARSVRLDEAEDRDGIVAGGIAMGSFAHRASMPAGIVGGMIGGCTECVGSWTDPDDRSSTWTSTSGPLGGSAEESGQSAFSGPAGPWSWGLNGTKMFPIDSAPVLFAYAPVGDLWAWFPVSASP